MKKNKILIVGSIALDTIETPTDKREKLLGGSVSYALVSAGYKSKVSVVGIVGEDFPEYGHNHYKKYAADLSDFEVVEGQTFQWGGKYHDNGDDRDTLFTELGVFEKFNPTLSEDNKNHPWVFLANIHPSLQLSVMNQCGSSSKFIVDTMNLWIDITREELDNVISKTHILLLNESEAEMITSSKEPKVAAKSLMDMGPDIVVIKLGSKGAKVFWDDKEVSVGVYPVENVVDPTGAGDTFGGGFISALASGKSLQNALIEGSAWASFCVEGFGVEPLTVVTEESLQNRIDKIQLTVTP
ncbi:MAG: bifunctional hydroxymethylpyrimidine kinase/phosphomethylpyrimidine kinase [Candidatus Marinimicrobia bacterium]|nr:bifunctional hydroxymethylpyrimidine kinase/phosphomethylpyrimidine kinase [Candidatus Neomarinimicrobiota bacterium]